MVSAPAPPISVSLPINPSKLSVDSSPHSSSSTSVPTRISAPAVPIIGAFLASNKVVSENLANSILTNLSWTLVSSRELIVIDSSSL